MRKLQSRKAGTIILAEQAIEFSKHLEARGIAERGQAPNTYFQFAQEIGKKKELTILSYCFIAERVTDSLTSLPADFPLNLSVIVKREREFDLIDSLSKEIARTYGVVGSLVLGYFLSSSYCLDAGNSIAENLDSFIYRVKTLKNDQIFMRTLNDQKTEKLRLNYISTYLSTDESLAQIMEKFATTD